MCLIIYKSGGHSRNLFTSWLWEAKRKTKISSRWKKYENVCWICLKGNLYFLKANPEKFILCHGYENMLDQCGKWYLLPMLHLVSLRYGTRLQETCKDLSMNTSLNSSQIPGSVHSCSVWNGSCVGCGHNMFELLVYLISYIICRCFFPVCWR